MKRSKNIDLDKMNKESEGFIDTPTLAVAGKVALLMGGVYMLKGCDSSQAYIYRTIAECELDNPLQRHECTPAYEEAQQEWKRTAPRYLTNSDCEYDFGYGECRSHSNRFIPVMAGFMLQENSLTDDEFDLDFSYSKPLGRSKHHASHNQWVGAGGNTFGSYSRTTVKVGKKTVKPLKGTGRTMGRGGFGKTISSRASRGG